MNKLLKFELAKPFKEKGLKIEVDEPLFYIDEIENIEEHQIKNREIVHVYQGYGFFIPEENEYQTYTIGEVVMWLYAKHGIWISVSCDCGNDNLFYSKIFSTEIGIERCLWTIEGYSSPTEAYEAAIEHTLKNLML